MSRLALLLIAVYIAAVAVARFAGPGMVLLLIALYGPFWLAGVAKRLWQRRA